MKLFAITQDPGSSGLGYDIGFAIGKFLPFIVLILIAYFLFKYFKKKSNNQ